jgi:ATP-dependent DNA helicase RecG
VVIGTLSVPQNSNEMDLSTPIEQIPRIGPSLQKKLKKLGIKTVKDLIFHFPHRYEDFSNLTEIAKAKVGEKICVRGKILAIENTKTWKKRMILTEAIVKDETGAIKVIWFNQPYLINVLKEGDFVSLAGKVAFGRKSKRDLPEIYLQSPTFEKIFPEKELVHTGRIVPIYPETEGLSSKWLRMIIRPLLKELKDKIEEVIPEEILKKYKLLPIKKAIWQVHFPDSLNLANKAKERFSFEELFLLQLRVLKEKLKLKSKKAISIPFNLELVKKFIDSLPFELTEAQKKAAYQILKDLEKERPMNRLLQGDVGSGKTVVAILAALEVAKAGYQVALMAPTEILAKQHLKTFSEFLKNFEIEIGLLTSGECRISNKKVKEKEILERVKEGKVKILIGTHSLIQNRVEFKNLALVILDEQHRFGVEQRARLVQKSAISNQKSTISNLQSTIKIPHLLSMTATPIPRTLALTIYGDLDLSIIDQLPKGRKKVITKAISPSEREKAYRFIRKEVEKGRQVFVICPRIEPTESAKYEEKTSNLQTSEFKLLSWAEVKAVKDEYQKLSKDVFPDLRVEMLHGRMKTEEKEKIMKDFKNGKIDILVSTSVVEVGIDVPNATIMMVEGAERFGLAQLHQFRGRVGRGKYQSYCFLFTESPSKKTAKRLQAIMECQDGFKLAEKDLEIRGPGEIFGQKQWGIPDLAMASLKDIFLVEKTRNAAKEILEKDWQLKNYPALKRKLEEFEKEVHLE